MYLSKGCIIILLFQFLREIMNNYPETKIKINKASLYFSDFITADSRQYFLFTQYSETFSFIFL